MTSPLRRALLGLALSTSLLAGCAPALLVPPERGSGDMGLVIERESGSIGVLDTSARTRLGTIEGLGDLSHASVVFARDGASAYVFGRDGALTKVNLRSGRIEGRVMQAGNSIGGAISQDGTLVVAQNYQPGGIKVFDARTLAPLADIPAVVDGKASRVVGLADLPGRRFIYSLFDAGQTWIVDLADPARPLLTKFENIGKQPYDALISPDGRYYIAGLFGEDGLAKIDLWAPQPRVERILPGYGKGEQPLPVFKMPHLRGWSIAGRHAYLPAIGRREVLVVDTETWKEVGRIPVAGQPVFVMARPDGRQVWVNFAVPDYDTVQVIDTQTRQVVHNLKPGKAVLHMEFTPRGDAVWISARDDHHIAVIDTASFKTLALLPARSPSGIFFTSRAARMGF
ncbi:MAG TPA: cytochrome D1 domain-containing protein [Ottowia sp.]|jgi:protein NirF|nr:cytochrome D1 domain-containing protein [Ottowia sp.]HMT63658.1 cytochrome D1 domain-containing protein [Ottowia sp.]HMT82219.1 cytochrome D1 domain-containing protein [Ottowia sp.]HOM20885.1 cytochrome D1 domain-containing protein [Ottowia sp.]HON30105.1 cytochrome D1 domain-containing protein [Ottowia sp.]